MVAGAPGGPPLADEAEGSTAGARDDAPPDWAVRGSGAEALAVPGAARGAWTSIPTSAARSPAGRQPRTSASSGCCGRRASRSACWSPTSAYPPHLRAARRDLRLALLPAAQPRHGRRPADARRAEAHARPRPALHRARSTRRLPKLLDALARGAERGLDRARRAGARRAARAAARPSTPPIRSASSALAASRPQHLYEGLLTTLMRLVFLLYAEDRDLMPIAQTARPCESTSRAIRSRRSMPGCSRTRRSIPTRWTSGVGGWGQLLALFRLVHGGHRIWLDHGARRQAVRPRCVSLPRRPRRGRAATPPPRCCRSATARSCASSKG